MAAEVSSMVREVSGYKEEGEGKKDLVTRDLLGGGGEIDVGLKVPVGWERRLDLLSGKTRNQKSGGSDPVFRELHDLNLPPPPPPPPSGGTVIPEESSSLDLALSRTAARAAPASAYRSVCTLEKVKSALERAERESRWSYRLPADCGSSASPSSSTTSSSLKRRATEDGESTEAQDSLPLPSAPAGGMVAAGCPCCLLYVLISTADPRCPRCDSQVPVPAMKKKKPRIDLNSSSSHYY